MTNSLEVATVAVPYANLDVICLAGKLERTTNSFIASDTVQMMERYNVKKAFLAATGISVNGGVTNSSLLEFEVKKAAVRNCEQSYLLIDSIKFRKVTLMTYCCLDQIGCVITDGQADQEFLELCERFGTRVDIAQAY